MLTCLVSLPLESIVCMHGESTRHLYRCNSSLLFNILHTINTAYEYSEVLAVVNRSVLTVYKRRSNGTVSCHNLFVLPGFSPHSYYPRISISRKYEDSIVLLKTERKKLAGMHLLLEPPDLPCTNLTIDER